MSKKEDFDWEMISHVGGIDHIEKIKSKNNHSMYRIFCENGMVVERSSKATKEIYNKALNGEPLPWDKPPVNDLTGQKFNKLTVLRPLSKKEVKDNNLQSGVYSQQWWLCQCECGNYKYATTHGLLSENVKSCGCLSIEKTIERNTTHNLYNNDIYGIWSRFRDRCTNPDNKDYPSYGGRGVFVADEWEYDPEDPEKGFKKFYDDMYEDFEKKAAENPGEIISLDRIDNQFGYYGPGQTQWATPTEQARNTSKNILVEYLGKEYSIQDLMDELEPFFNEELTRDMFSYRIRSGWSVNEALTIPADVKRTRYNKRNGIQIPVSFENESISPNLGCKILPKKTYPTREEYEKYWNERGMDINTGKKISELDQVHLPKFTIIDED